jgi:methyltransferase (TIGR00027 family)
MVARMSTVVSNISDTARWVAIYRARESQRPDALFNDPFAAQLGGELGARIAGELGSMHGNGWPIIVRTRLIDDLVLQSLAEGCDRVLNLAAGLDTRPYRLRLPAELQWIEADLPAMVDEKTRMMATHAPACRLSREKVDLADAAARREFLTRALGGAKKALVLTEGLLVYLPAETVSDIARDLHAQPNVTWWMMDLSSPRVLAMLRARTRDRMSSDAQFQFAPPNGVAFFEPLGWRAREVKSLFRAAAKWRRLPLFLRLLAKVFRKDPSPRNPGRNPFAAVVRFERA